MQTLGKTEKERDFLAGYQAGGINYLKVVVGILESAASEVYEEAYPKEEDRQTYGVLCGLINDVKKEINYIIAERIVSSSK
jgi:hypothetical protein